MVIGNILGFLGDVASTFIPGAAPLVQGIKKGVDVIGKVLNPQNQTSESTAAAIESVPSQSQNQSALPEQIRLALKNADSTLANASKTSQTVPKSSAARAMTLSSADPSNPTNASTKMKDGQAVFENDNYIITAGDNNTVTIFNKKTEEVYEGVGNDDMRIDGQAGFASKGTLSLMLDDGTKVTLGKADDGKGGSLASKLTITNGAYGAQIKGIDTNKTGDLAVQEFVGQGQALDDQVEDGVVIEENQNMNVNNGRGFVVKDNNGASTVVTSDYFGKTNQTNTKAENLDKFDAPDTQPTPLPVPLSSTKPEIPVSQSKSTRTLLRPINQMPKGCFDNLKPKDVIQKSKESNKLLPLTLPKNVRQDRNFNVAVSIKSNPSNSTSIWA